MEDALPQRDSSPTQGSTRSRSIHPLGKASRMGEAETLHYWCSEVIFDLNSILKPNITICYIIHDIRLMNLCVKTEALDW